MADETLHPALQPAPEPSPAPRKIETDADRARVLEEFHGTPATARLRAFEDKHLGKNAVRISGAVEKGHGSAFALKMIETPELRREYAALERLHETEQALGVAEGALSAAQSVHATALAAADEAAKAADIKPEPVKAA